MLWGGAPSLPPHWPKLGQHSRGFSWQTPSEDLSDYGEAIAKLGMDQDSRFVGPEMLVILMIEALPLRMFSDPLDT